MIRRRDPRYSLPIQAMAVLLLAVSGFLFAHWVIGWAG